MKNSKKVWKQNQLYLKRCKSGRWCEKCFKYTWDGRKWNVKFNNGICMKCASKNAEDINFAMNRAMASFRISAQDCNDSLAALAKAVNGSFYETEI